MLKMKKIFNGGGGGGKSGPSAPPPQAPPPPPPPAAEPGPDPAMQAEIEKQRALRYQAGQIGQADTTGSGVSTEDKTKTTILGA